MRKIVLTALAALAVLLLPPAAKAAPLPHTDWHACHLMVEFSRGHATRQQVISAASHANPDLGRAIIAFAVLRTGDAWRTAMQQCGRTL